MALAPFQRHSIGMRRVYWILLTIWLLCGTMPGQTTPSMVLHDALVLENRGSFEAAAKVAKASIDSGDLKGDELGRAYTILAVASQGKGDLPNAKVAFERALQVLENAHAEDYASALDNYAAFYSELGQRDVAAAMWRKAFHLRQRIRDHAGTTLSLTRLAELALTRNQVREARRYLKEASQEAKDASNFTDDDKAFFFETQGLLAIAQHQAPTAVGDYRHALELEERSRGRQHWLAGWEHMLLGKAYAECGDFRSALENMQTGLTILRQALGQKNPKYFAAELAYSQVLDRSGLHAEAAQMRAAAEKASSQCPGCTINVAAFR